MTLDPQIAKQHPWFHKDNKPGPLDLSKLDMIIEKMSMELINPHPTLEHMIKSDTFLTGETGTIDILHLYQDKHLHVMNASANAGFKMAPHNHIGCDEIFNVISGKIIILASSESTDPIEHALSAGETFMIKGNIEHSVCFLEDSSIRIIIIPPDPLILDLEESDERI